MRLKHVLPQVLIGKVLWNVMCDLIHGRLKDSSAFPGAVSSVVDSTIPKLSLVTADHVVQARSGAGSSSDGNSKEGNG